MWSFILTAVGLTGFILAGKKVWWAWWVNVGCQALWATYAVVTHQYGFIIAAGFYTVVFMKNALAWTKEHRDNKKYPNLNKDPYSYLHFTPGSQGVAIGEALGIPVTDFSGDDPIKYLRNQHKDEVYLIYKGLKTITGEQMDQAIAAVEGDPSYDSA